MRGFGIGVSHTGSGAAHRESVGRGAGRQNRAWAGTRCGLGWSDLARSRKLSWPLLLLLGPGPGMAALRGCSPILRKAPRRLQNRLEPCGLLQENSCDAK